MWRYKNRNKYDKVMNEIINKIENQDAEIEIKWEIEFADCKR